MAQLPRYRRTLAQSYAVGHFVALELLRHRPERARRVFVHPALDTRRQDALAALCHRHGVPISEDARVLESLGAKRNIQAAAVFDKYPETLMEASDHLVLLAPGEPGNLGTILRSAAAFGVRDAALIGDVDPFNPHVVRASLGTRFLVRCAVFPDLAAYRDRYPHPLYPFTAEAANELTDAVFCEPCALLFGPEWPGLPLEARRLGTPLRITHADDVESLALPAAVSIALYTLFGQRRTPNRTKKPAP